MLLLHQSMPTFYGHRSLLEELSLTPRFDALLKNRVILLLIEGARAGNYSWDRPIKRIESMALDLCPNEEEGETKTARTEGPKQAADGRCYESAYMPVRLY